MKHLVIDCENIETYFPNISITENQHIWLLLYEGSEVKIPIILGKNLLQSPQNISIIRFPKNDHDQFFYALSFQLGKISIEDPEADFLLMTTKSFIEENRNLFQKFNLKLTFQVLTESKVKIESFIPLPSDKPNKVPESTNNQNSVVSKVFKLIAYDLFYQKSYFPKCFHNLLIKIRKYTQEFQNLYSQKDEDFIVEKIINTLKNKEYIFIYPEGHVSYHLSAEDVYHNIINQIQQSHPTHYYQVMKIISLETDFLKLSWKKLTLLFDRIISKENVFVRIDEFILYLDDPIETEYLQEIAYKVALNTLANPEIQPTTLSQLSESLKEFNQFNIRSEQIIEQLVNNEIIDFDHDLIIYNPKYQLELDKNFSTILHFLCKVTHHTQPRYRETLINYTYRMLEEIKVDFFTIYLLYYRLLTEKYIIYNGRYIEYYLPSLENWD